MLAVRPEERTSEQTDGGDQQQSLEGRHVAFLGQTDCEVASSPTK